VIKAGIIGLGKMGLSHYAIINSHPDVQLVAACDASTFVLSALGRHITAQTFTTDYKEMIDRHALDCVVISTPTVTHAEIVRYALERHVHVFVEKPFCLTLEDGRALTALAEKNGLVNQVGYHNRFIGSFREARRLVETGAIGSVQHFMAEAYGPVVLRPPAASWRYKKSEGGGCLSDYASHVVNLVHYLVGNPSGVSGTVLKSLYSREVEDAVYATVHYASGTTGQLAVNWSDETFRKMTTRVTLWGSNGKLYADRQELRVYLKDASAVPGYTDGWTIRYTTDLTEPVDYYLRGEEYSAQMWYFVDRVKNRATDNLNSFTNALQTDELIALLREDGERRGRA
jgi:predicted dehydrogenase